MSNRRLQIRVMGPSKTNYPRKKELAFRLERYSEEIGLVDELQNRGLGSALSAMRLNEAKSLGFKRLITRTINPAIKNMLKGMFSQKEGEYMFNDPEKKKSEWYTWNFEDFNLNVAKDLIRRI